MSDIYTDASKAMEVIQHMLDADDLRRQNRSLVTEIFDGEPPYSDEEVEENNIETNVNFLEGAMIMHDARNQYRNAFMKPGNFCTVAIDGFSEHQERMKAGKIITKEMNKIMKASREYGFSLKSQFANVALHGYGPAVWPNIDSWKPVPYGVNDILIPDKTYLDLSNLGYFAVYREYTPHEFWRITRSGDGWNMKMVNKILSTLMASVASGDTRDREENYYQNPELMTEEIKENSGYWESDAIPVIRTWTLYTRDLESEDKCHWLRLMVPDYNVETMENEFIFKSKTPYAEDHSQIFHTFWGNVANQAPFRFHSIRSLGFLLYSVVQLQNRLRCKLNDSIFENLMWYFRVSDPTDRDRIQRIDLHHLGIIPEGVSVVGRDERWQPDMNFINMGLLQNRQLMGEAAASYRGQASPGEERAKSARQVSSEMSQLQMMVSAILGSAYDDSVFQYREIARRFSKPVTTCPEVKLFRERVLKQGVDKKWLDFERWEVDPVRVMGGGNKMVEQAQAELLMSIRPLLDPNSQRRALHLYVEANTDDPSLANSMVPMEEEQFPSNSVIEGQQNAGVLLSGLPVGIPQEVNRNEYVAAQLQTLNVKIQQIEQQGAVPKDADELRGMVNLSSHIAQNLELLQGDKGQSALVKSFNSQLAQANNIIRAYSQRLAEKMKSEQAQGDPKAMAEIQNTMVKEQVKARGKVIAQNQSAQFKQQAFEAEQQRKAQEHAQNMAIKQQEHDQSISNAAIEARINAALDGLV